MSSSEAKRMIRQFAVSIDGEKINDPNKEITPTDGMVIQVGKRKFARLKVSNYSVLYMLIVSKKIKNQNAKVKMTYKSAK